MQQRSLFENRHITYIEDRFREESTPVLPSQGFSVMPAGFCRGRDRLVTFSDFEVTPAERDALLESIAEADRGEVVDGWLEATRFPFASMIRRLVVTARRFGDLGKKIGPLARWRRFRPCQK